MHLCFVPLTEDHRLSAKEILGNKKKLSQWQDKFWEHMVQKYVSLERGESASKTARDHLEKLLGEINPLNCEAKAAETAKVLDKSGAIQRKAPLGAYHYEGIRILILRREYGDMENPIISPMLKCLAPGSYQYNKSEHMITFTNGSTIKFGNMRGYGAAVQGKYQGQEYDWLFIDEATQFLENGIPGPCGNGPRRQ